MTGRARKHARNPATIRSSTTSGSAVPPAPAAGSAPEYRSSGQYQPRFWRERPVPLLGYRHDRDFDGGLRHAAHLDDGGARREVEFDGLADALAAMDPAEGLWLEEAAVLQDIDPGRSGQGDRVKAVRRNIDCGEACKGVRLRCAFRRRRKFASAGGFKSRAMACGSDPVMGLPDSSLGIPVWPSAARSRVTSHLNLSQPTGSCAQTCDAPDSTVSVTARAMMRRCIISQPRS